MAFAQANLRHLVTVYGDLTVDVWSPDAADGERSTPPARDRLHANGHSRIVAVCSDAGLVVFADHDGTVSMWEAFGVRRSDPLPPDPAHYDVVAIAASAGFAATAGRASRNLRIWQPSSGKVSLVPMAFAPEWLTFTGTILTVGNADSAVSFSIIGTVEDRVHEAPDLALHTFQIALHGDPGGGCLGAAPVDLGDELPGEFPKSAGSMSRT
jgi:hypothetical protein